MSVYLFVTKNSRFALLAQPKLAEDDQAGTYLEELGVEQARIRGLLDQANRLIASADLTPEALKVCFQKIANLANGGSRHLRAALTNETNALWKKACVAGIQLTQAALKQALDSCGLKTCPTSDAVGGARGRFRSLCDRRAESADL